MFGVTRKLLGELSEYVEVNEKGMPKPQALSLWNMPYAKRRALTKFARGVRWQFIVLFIALYNFKNRDDSHLLRRGAYN
uniref:ATPEG6 n=1 Tax=Euglena gracilis TaxID=3039 RepID=UPI0012B67DDD|nr:Chain R, ATPEG6 [Euglena gracilis]6TDU_r Chain r, ATPEG6 [Euglena gracilis]6TDV_R Chain R, ATPEG6 [Euglena gracilis]6TDV_r Chain r, ATPEG6 [Euglena gracilis]